MTWIAAGSGSQAFQIVTLQLGICYKGEVRGNPAAIAANESVGWQGQGGAPARNEGEDQIEHEFLPLEMGKAQVEVCTNLEQLPTAQKARVSAPKSKAVGGTGCVSQQMKEARHAGVGQCVD